MKAKRNVTRTVIIVCLAAFFTLCVAAPIIAMFSNIRPEHIAKMFGKPQFLPALVNTLTTSLTSTVISVALALCAAFAVCRSSIRGKSVFGVLFVIPMLIPSISHAYGIKALFGVNGNGMLAFILGDNFSITGFWGIVIGSVMYSFPVAYLMIQTVLQYEDGLPYKAAEVLGIPAFRRFTGITLPYMKKTLISAFFAVFTMIVTDYGVPQVFCTTKFGQTLSLLMYNEIHGDSGSSNAESKGMAAVIGIILLIPAVAAFIIDMVMPENSQSGFVTDTVSEKKSKVKNIISYAFCGVMSVSVLAPIIVFSIQMFVKSYPNDMSFTFDNIIKTFDTDNLESLKYSVIYALLAALFGTVIAFICSYLTSRTNSKLGKILHLASITSVAIPGLVLGLSYVIFFHGSFIYGTVFIIVLVNTIHFITSPYLMMYNTLGKVNRDLEDVGKTLGIKRIRIIFDVLVPKVRFTLYEMFTYFFVNSMMTISAVSFLVPPPQIPLAVRIPQAEGHMEMGSVAVISLVILAVNLILKLVFGIIKKVKFKNKNESIPA